MTWVLWLLVTTTPVCVSGVPCPPPTTQQQQLRGGFLTQAACLAQLATYRMAFDRRSETTVQGMRYVTTGTLRCEQEVHR